MKKNVLSVVVCLFFILSFLVSLSYIAVEAGHDCDGHDCPVCLHLQEIINILKQPTALFAAIAAYFIFVFFNRIRAVSKQLLFYKRRSLVSLKVIMND